MVRRLPLLAWLLLCVVTLVITLLASSPTGGRNDIGLFFIGCMIVLTFPSGLGIIGLAALLIEVQSRTGVMTIGVIGSNYFGFIFLWTLLVSIGYLQWFVLLPWLWRKWKAR
jgi:hypothetical protein